MADKTLLGELLIQQNLVSRETIDEALRLQITGYRRLGSILVRMGALSEDRLAEVLARQLNTEPTDIASTFSREVRRKLPRHLCRRYDAIPLRLKSNNILEVAMADPSDHQVIKDLEQYTGNIVEPRLARHSDITSATSQYIPLSWSDIMSPQSSTRMMVALCLVLVAAIGTGTYQYIKQTKYGVITRPTPTNQATTYTNLDLIVNHNPAGKISLSGRGAFSKGMYNASFNDLEGLKSFREKRATDFSQKQQEWLDWVLGQAEKETPRTIAAKQ
jgi:hypothetical protein